MFGESTVFASGTKVIATGKACVLDTPVTSTQADLLDNDGSSIFRYEPSAGGGKISSCPTADGSCGAATVVLGLNLGSVVALTHDSNRVAWATASTVQTVLKTGGAIVTLATQQKLPKALAASGGFIYWTNYDEGTVQRAPAAGGEVKLVRDGFNHPWGLVVTATHVIVASSGSGRVTRFTKP